jgi:hypothetical protein
MEPTNQPAIEAAPPAAPGPPPEQRIELLPGYPFCTPAELNRIARQQGLCLAIAQASVFDEICRAVPLDAALEWNLIHAHLTEQGIDNDAAMEAYFQRKGWSHDDLAYFATKGARLQRFKRAVFREEVEIRFLERKLDLDQVEYSLIRVEDESLAFELHQRLLEGEASFAELAPAYSTGPERESGGRVGPLSLTQAHPVVAEKLRISQPGQLWPPFFLVNIWLILRLEKRHNTGLDDSLREELLSELFHLWLEARVSQLLAGETPGSLPLHLLHDEPPEPAG